MITSNKFSTAKAVATFFLFLLGACSEEEIAPQQEITGKSNPQESLYVEDCLSFNPAKLTVKKSGNLWLVVEGNHSMFAAPNSIEAKRIVKIIQHYNLNRSCFVGRPDASFQYMLKGVTSPIGAMTGEDCIAFNPAKLYIKHEGTRYLLTDGVSRMFVFPRKIEAELTLTYIRKYGFTRTCYVGRPNASLQYMRK